MGALVTGANPGALAVMRVTPAASALMTTPPEAPSPAFHTPEAATLAAEGTELVKVMAMFCTGFWLFA